MGNPLPPQLEKFKTYAIRGGGIRYHFFCGRKKVQIYVVLVIFQTLPKAQRTRGLSSFCQSKFLRAYHKFKHKSTSTKNLNQTSASPQNLKFKILTKPSFRISTKIQLHNLYKTSAAKCCTNFNFKILTNPCAQSLNKSLALGPNVSSQICNKL